MKQSTFKNNNLTGSDPIILPGSKETMRHSTIQFGKNTVTKTSDPDLMRVEVEKNRQAYDIGKRYGIFQVPKVLDFDESKGVAVFERIYEINPIRNIINQTKHYNTFVEQAGRSLAIIHNELVLPEDMIFELPSEFSLPGTEVFIHGDFNGINVAVVPNSPSIVILDWQMTSRHGGQATYGSRYFDLIWFINYFIWSSTFKDIFNKPVIKVARLFLQSYFSETDFPYNAEIIEKYSKRFFAAKLPDRKQNVSWRKRCLVPRKKTLTKKFINSIRYINQKNNF